LVFQKLEETMGVEGRKLKRIVLALVLSTLGVFVAARSAEAGTIVVSGDSNFTDSLSAANNNGRFLLNVLAGGNAVAVLNFTNGSFGSASNTDDEVNAFYGAQAGVTSTLVSGTVTAATFAGGVDLFVVALPDDPFTAGEVSAISSFLSAGGNLLLFAENNNAVFNSTNAALNQLLADLGSSMAIVPAILSNPGVVTPDPFTAGIVGDFNFAAGSQVTGGTTLYATNSGLGMIARQDVGSAAPVPEPGTFLLLGGGLALLWRRLRP
jgi:PEP-CTERM motif